MTEENDRTIRLDERPRMDFDSQATIRDRIQISRGPSIGDVLMGRYEVLKKLGEGGMGVVYRCLDKVAGVEIALKMLPPEVSHDESEMEDVRDNFQLVSGLYHQNIAALKTLELDPSTRDIYLVMEYVNGMDLKRWIRRRRDGDGRVPLAEALPILRQVADALDFAHQKKIIHRDIKPGNVMVTEDGVAKVLDFGLAAQIHSSMSRVSMAYQGTSGTRTYMPPEQWQGKPQGAAADQYALAVMAYEMLSGHLPFDVTDPVVLREAVLKEQADAIDGLPAGVNEALQRGMAKEPSQRYPNCIGMVQALESAVDGCAPEKKTESEPPVMPPAEPPVVTAVPGDVDETQFPGEPPKQEEHHKIVVDVSAESDRDADADDAVLEEYIRPKKKKKPMSAVDKACLFILLLAVAAGVLFFINQLSPSGGSSYGGGTSSGSSGGSSYGGGTSSGSSGGSSYGGGTSSGSSGGSSYGGGSTSTGSSGYSSSVRATSDKVVSLPNGATMTLKPVQAGSFRMGSPSNETDRFDNETQHRVTLTCDFWLGKTEVTQAQYEAVMGTNPSYFKGSNLPVENVSWNDAMVFCKKLTERERNAGRLPNGYEFTLPTEAQWEYACRGGNKSRGYVYSGSDSLGSVAWYDGNSNGKTHSVGQKNANELGLYDMSGNVWEWCRDWYGGYGGDATDPTGASSGSYRVFRGGGWNCFARDCRAANRYANAPGSGDGSLGFRVALAPVP